MKVVGRAQGVTYTSVYAEVKYKSDKDCLKLPKTSI
jgi:hypothetical protein